ncbi:MAG: GTPase/DUF3482 domain-containing protein [Gammaproteobacteria bacterium]|nr:GTPase/DUF3482 domain-containing protein [Gammaproteobacteria bacterium]
MIPAFAVVGQPNKGKSSIVATLAEDERIAIAPTPGTTREAHRYTLSIDGEPQYELVDTPGFQRARAVLDWLEARAGSAQERPAVVARFVAEHDNDPRFHDECELLRPIVDGAGILYVVDGAKPYGPEYELEMQVLQWTGRPRMALINLIGEGDYVEEWRQGLDQYFSIVRVFDAIRADFSKRLALLRAFAELDESWRGPIESAVAALTAERERRRRRAAAEIADCLTASMAQTERAPLKDADAASADRRRELEAQLLERLRDRIRDRERDARDRVQSIYRHQATRREEAATELLATDIFTAEGWELFGLSRTQLIVSGALSGAVAGGGIDVLLGGASLLLGSGLGAVMGGAGAWFGGNELARVKVLGRSLGGRLLQVGPVKAPNFPWVMLGRAWVHHRLVAERNHARRESLSLAVAGDEHLMDQLPERLRKDLAGCFRKLFNDPHDTEAHQRLRDLLETLLALEVEA